VNRRFGDTEFDGADTAGADLPADTAGADVPADAARADVPA